METLNPVRAAFLDYMEAEEIKKWWPSEDRERVCAEKWEVLEKLLRDSISKA